MRVKNPTSNSITVQILGTKYTVPADGEVGNIPAEVAKFWQENLHNFLILSEDKTREVPAMDEIVEELKQEVMKEEKPKANKK